MKPVVADSSVTVKWINQINEQLLEQADKLLEDARVGKVSLLAPELSKYEIGNAILKKKLDLPKAHESLSVAYQLPITFIPESEDLSKETYKIAKDFGITYYDASFMALAKEQKADLVTDNPKHQNKKISGLSVISLKNYH